jgi:hypothetical protein
MNIFEEWTPMSIYNGYSMIFGKKRLTALVLLAFLAGCGGGGTGSGGDGTGGDGGDGGDGGGGGPDTTSPTVTTMSPGEDSGGTGTNSKLAATLSEAMVAAVITAIDPATSNPANFRVTNGSNAIPGTVTYDSTSHVAVFTPTSPLIPNTRYTATVITGVKDLAGNPLMKDFAWCFVTGAGADSTAPSVTSTLPADGAADVAVNRKITATFSEEMNSSTLTPANFSVAGPGATPVSGTVIYLGRTAVFKPSSGLAANTTYTATIGAGATDLAGNASQAKTWSFTTGASADVTAPVVASFSPADAATGVPIGTAFKVILSEPMDPATITTANFFVTGPGTDPVTGTVAFDVSSNTATFTRINHLITPVLFHPTPVSNLEPNTTYTATLTTGARDMAGKALAGNLVWSFTTAP